MNPQFETVSPEAGSSFNFTHFQCESFAADHTWHYHPQYELTWITRSSGTRFVGNSIQPYEPGDLVLIGPGLPHCWHNDDHGETGEQPELFLLQFDEDVLGERFFALPEARGLRDMLRESARGLHFPSGLVDSVGPLLRRLEHARSVERIILFLDILGTLATSARKPLAAEDYQMANDISPANRSRIEKVHRFVRDHLRDDICQAEVADRLNMTPSAFSKFFRSATGHTFVNFINILRINEACRLLSTTDANITQIAMQTGYNNISHFNRQFFQLKATTPSDFRKGRSLLEPSHPPAPRFACPV